MLSRGTSYLVGEGEFLPANYRSLFSGFTEDEIGMPIVKDGGLGFLDKFPFFPMISGRV
jgi:hypothetical protein